MTVEAIFADGGEAAVPRARARRRRRRVRVADAARHRVRRRNGASIPRTGARCAPPGVVVWLRAPTATLLVARRRRLDPAAAARRSRGCARRGSSGCASSRTRPPRTRRVDTDDLDVAGGRRRGAVGVRRGGGMSARIRVDLGARGYDVVVGADAVAELGTVLAGRRRAAVVTQAAIPAALVDDGARRARPAPASRTRRSSWATARTTRRSPRSTTSAAGSRSGDSCAATRCRARRRESSATPRASRRRCTTAASTSCRCRPRCSRWSTPRSAARPA